MEKKVGAIANHRLEVLRKSSAAMQIGKPVSEDLGKLVPPSSPSVLPVNLCLAILENDLIYDLSA